MKKGLRFLVSFIALAAAAACAVAPAFSYRAPEPYKEGVTASGVLPVGGKCDLAVESQKLAIQVNNLSDVADYSGTYTQEYKFANHTESAVTAQLAFPCGNLPYYEINNKKPTPNITLDGTAVTATERYTYGGAYLYDYNDSIKTLRNEYYSDNFFTPEMEVYEYTLTLETASKNTDIRCINTQSLNPAKVRYIGEGSNDCIDLSMYNGARIATFYLLGDETAFKNEWEVKGWKYEEGYVPLEGTASAKKTATYTLEEFLLKDYNAELGMSRVDWFNNRVTNFPLSAHLCNALPAYDNSNLIKWYVYDVTVQPEATVTNVITAPIFPEINVSMQPYVYSYKYNVVPADSWSSFGTLDIAINTPLYLTSGVSALEKTQTGYAVSYPIPVINDFEISLSTAEDPEYVQGEELFPGGWVVLSVIGILMMALPVILIIEGVIIVGALIWALVYSLKK